MTYALSMYIIIETPAFEEERGAFCAWLAANPEIGDVIPKMGGAGKYVGQEQIQGKRRCTNYSKAVKGNIPAHIFKAIREALEDE